MDMSVEHLPLRRKGGTAITWSVVAYGEGLGLRRDELFLTGNSRTELRVAPEKLLVFPLRKPSQVCVNATTGCQPMVSPACLAERIRVDQTD